MKELWILDPRNTSAMNSVMSGEKHKTQLLLQRQYLREERRGQMQTKFAIAQAEQQNDELTFSSDINELRQLIED